MNETIYKSINIITTTDEPVFNLNCHYKFMMVYSTDRVLLVNINGSGWSNIEAGVALNMTDGVIDEVKFKAIDGQPVTAVVCVSDTGLIIDNRVNFVDGVLPVMIVGQTASKTSKQLMYGNTGATTSFSGSLYNQSSVENVYSSVNGSVIRPKKIDYNFACVAGNLDPELFTFFRVDIRGVTQRPVAGTTGLATPSDGQPFVLASFDFMESLNYSGTIDLEGLEFETIDILYTGYYDDVVGNEIPIKIKKSLSILATEIYTSEVV